MEITTSLEYRNAQKELDGLLVKGFENLTAEEDKRLDELTAAMAKYEDTN